MHAQLSRSLVKQHIKDSGLIIVVFSGTFSGLGVPQLRALFVEVFGEQTASNNAAWLRRKLAQPPDDDMGRGRSPVVRARDQQAAIWTKGCSKPGDQSSPQASSPTDNSGEATATIADAGEQAQHSSRSDGTAEDAGAHDGNIAAVTSAENATGSQVSTQHHPAIRLMACCRITPRQGD